ncbi:hypothetical protein HYG81_20620 (plasmid) [Natrinema zhouii]|uniref:hypothetical protein n=1 Tax=Natrinema zhouii TaxID=1710539 RepID=UPI001D001885|nr:hypothetical protein [Natrinema zhouii]UHQ98027.1 hypothetical protein HYG81_20620 [Natrinema zhouii]
MSASLSINDILLIEALIAYHHDLRERDPDHARRVWKRARDLAAERGETIDDVVSSGSFRDQYR